MRELALECLVKVLQCIVFWYEELQHVTEQQGTSKGSIEPSSSDFHLDQHSDTGSVMNGSGGGNFHDQLVQVKKQKGMIEQGIYLFSQKPKNGLAFLHSQRFVGNDPESIANFLHDEERLDKGMVGDYLGDGEE